MADGYDEAMTSGNDVVDYDRLMQVLFADAIGDTESFVEQEVLTRKTDDGEIRQVRSRKRPDISMALRLLNDRIGGPQDFC